MLGSLSGNGFPKKQLPGEGYLVMFSKMALFCFTGNYGRIDIGDNLGEFTFLGACNRMGFPCVKVLPLSLLNRLLQLLTTDHK